MNFIGFTLLVDVIDRDIQQLSGPASGGNGVPSGMMQRIGCLEYPMRKTLQREPSGELMASQ
jgi:hypothetical protein